MNNINDTPPDLTIKVLKEMGAIYKERAPEVYYRAFKAAVNRYIGRAKALQFMREGGHQ